MSAQRDKTEMTAKDLRAIVARHESANEFDVKEDPNPEAHADRGALLDLLRALGQGVPFRPGLPTAEQVWAHEARGGCWSVLERSGRF